MRAMIGELNFEAAPFAFESFGGEGEAESDYEVGDFEVAFGGGREPVSEEFETTSTAITPYSVIDSRIDVHAQYALLRMNKRGGAEQVDAIDMLTAVKAQPQRLAGIYKEDQAVPAKLAQRQGKGWWQLIPAGQDAAAVRDVDPNALPLIVFRDKVRSDASRLDPALRKAWAAARGGTVVIGAPPKLSPRELALTDRPLALSWARQGLRAVEHLESLLRGTGGAPTAQSVTWARALTTHFKIANVITLAGRRNTPEHRAALQRLVHIRDTYKLVIMLMQGDGRYQNAPPNFAQIFRNMSGGEPAYAFHKGGVFFTHNYKPSDLATGEGYGPPARAAMVLHEFVHVADGRSGEAAIHISEFDPRYDQQNADQAMHNPSGYAAFGQHACYGADTRFGAGAAVRHVQQPPAPACQ
ncbi:MAG TPA: hypothetical protein VK422_19445 [Pyrinomonadaceae bacterium]|nr:hypothetical protein [Pyrinomonadaceae bacterium]